MEFAEIDKKPIQNCILRLQIKKNHTLAVCDKAKMIKYSYLAH